MVTETVEFAKNLKGKGVAGFVNAVLRRFVRERERITLPEEPLKRLSVSCSFPRWIVERWAGRFGTEKTESLLRLQNEPPRFTLRVDTGKTTVADAVRELEALGVHAEQGKLLENALSVDRLAPVLGSRMFREKLVIIQGETSQLVASAFGGNAGRLVLDACAGLGTKTMQIRAAMPASTVVAMDNDMGRLGKMADKSLTVAGDGLHAPFRAGLFDTILVDAPCSSLGIIRKHPEIKWRRKEDDIIEFGKYQLDLLRSLWDNLRAGGRMIYSVCSFEEEETVGVLDRFRAEKEFTLEKPFPFSDREDYYLSLPQETGMDGFFIARLVKP